MISDSATHSLDRLFTGIVTHHLEALTDSSCSMQAIQETAEAGEREFALITLSSSAFKCLGIFHFNDSQAARSQFNRMSSVALDRFGQQAFRDAFLEFCNMCCGSLNRELVAYFPHLGMSTPYFLPRDCLPFITELNPGFSRHYCIRLKPDLLLHASLHLCDFGPVDFTARAADSGKETGELELF